MDTKRASKRQQAAMANMKTSSHNPGRDNSPLAHLEAGERSDRIVQAVQALDGSERATIVLHYLEGLSLRETAAVLNEPVGTVKWRTNRALKRLRALLDGRR